MTSARRVTLLSAAIGLACSCSGPGGAADEPPKKPVNLLFILTDQQRWDALGCAGNPVLKTPNLDRLAREGARFTNFYSSCPVCTPARTVILTGHGIESNRVRTNGDVDTEDLPGLPSFDQLLLRNGYKGEYHGKYHSPYAFAVDYTRPVRWLNGRQAPSGCKADMSESRAYETYLAAHVPDRAPRPGEMLSRVGLYTPDPLDPKFGGKPGTRGAEAEAYGCLDVPPEHTLAAWTVQEGLEALERLKDGPFTLTISIGPPHPPMVVPKPYYGMYPAATLEAPASLGDPRDNSPYRDAKGGKSDGYRNPDQVRQMISDYYGLVALDDDWIGKILARLDELGLADHTLVVFTSDHGEELGDHGLHGKAVFYEGAAHIPLLMRLPGVIPAGAVVKAPAAHIDLFPTILDYCGRPASASEGRDLRPLIDGKDDGADRIAVSEWASPEVPGFMVFDGRWKYLCGRSADAPSLDALYDLKEDPLELKNLIGNNPERDKHRGEAERMKGRLVGWLAGIKSPLLESVKARPVTGPAEPRPRKRR